MDEPKIEFLLIGDSIENTNGKLYVMGGGWMRFNSSRFPVSARVGIAVSVLVPSEFMNEQKRLPVHITCLNGNMKLEIEGNVEISPSAQNPLPDLQRVFVVLNMNLPIQTPGKYEIKARLDNNDEKAVYFDAILNAPLN